MYEGLPDSVPVAISKLGRRTDLFCFHFVSIFGHFMTFPTVVIRQMTGKEKSVTTCKKKVPDQTWIRHIVVHCCSLHLVSKYHFLISVKFMKICLSEKLLSHL